MEKFLETAKPVYGAAISADGFNGGYVSDAVNLSKYGEAALAMILTCASSTGTGKIQVQGCTAADGTGATAVDFEYQLVDAEGTPVDTVSARTAVVAATGVTTTAGKDGIYMIYVKPSKVAAIGTFARVIATEVVNDPVSVASMWLLGSPRYSGQGTAVS